jgi:hypothetical protein
MIATHIANFIGDSEYWHVVIIGKQKTQGH